MSNILLFNKLWHNYNCVIIYFTFTSLSSSKQSTVDFQWCSQSVFKVKLVTNLCFNFDFPFTLFLLYLSVCLYLCLFIALCFCFTLLYSVFLFFSCDQFFPFTNNYWHSLHAIQQNIMNTVSLVQNNNRKYNQGPKDDNRKDPNLPYHPGSRPPSQKGDHPFKVYRKWIPYLYSWLLCPVYSSCW